MKKKGVNKILIIIIIVLIVVAVLIIFNKQILNLSPQRNMIIGVGLGSPEAGEWKGYIGDVYYDSDYFEAGDLPTTIIERTAPKEDNDPSDPQFILDVRGEPVTVYVLIDKRAKCVTPEIHMTFPNKADWEATTKQGKQFEVYWNELSLGEYFIPNRFVGCEDRTEDAPKWNYIFVTDSKGLIPTDYPPREPKDPQPPPTPSGGGTVTPPISGVACGTENMPGDVSPEEMDALCSLGTCPNTPDGKKQICKADAAKSWCGCEPVGEIQGGDEPDEELPDINTGIPKDKNILTRARGVYGTEEIEIKTNEKTIATYTLSTLFQDYIATGSGEDIHVAFINDNGPRDVQIDYIKVNGITYQAEDQEINTGVWHWGCGGGSYSEWLHCNGYIEFSTISEEEPEQEMPESGAVGTTITQEEGEERDYEPNIVENENTETTETSNDYIDEAEPEQEESNNFLGNIFDFFRRRFFNK